MPASPNTINYFIGKGIITFTPTGGALRDLGNAPEIELTPNVEELEHFSSRSGVRNMDRKVVIEHPREAGWSLITPDPKSAEMTTWGRFAAGVVSSISPRHSLSETEKYRTAMAPITRNMIFGTKVGPFR